MNKHFFCILFLFFLFTSCVPTKDMIYLQDTGNNQNIAVNEIKNKPYRLQTNDILSISIKALDSKLVEIFSSSNNPNSQTLSAEAIYFSGYVVDDHGNIRIPIIGELNVLGSTIEETRKKIEDELLAKYFKKEAEIFVTVKLAGFRYTVNGEVINPGSKILYQDRVTILEALANCGDINMVGDKKDVKIMRQFPQGTEIFSIDLTNKNAIQSPYFYLQPNDYIYVKPLKQKSWGTGKTGVESITTLIAILSLATTTFLLFRN